MDARKPGVQELLYTGCRELDYQKVYEAIHGGADLSLMAAIQPDDVAIYDRSNVKFSPLSLVAMHGATNRKYPASRALDSKAAGIAALLLKHGARLDVCDSGDMGNTPLHWAIVSYKHEVCRLFIQHAIETQNNVINLANQPHGNYGGNPPLILALKVSSRGQRHSTYDLEIAELLVAAGADVHALDYQRQSALHWAAMLRLPASFFELLMERGARAFANEYGKTPAQLYQMKLSFELIQISSHNSFRDLGFHMIDWDKDPVLRDRDRSLMIGFRNEHHDQQVAAMLDLLDESVKNQKIAETPVDQRDDMGRTLLHNAVFYADLDHIRKILDRGCDVSIRDNTGLTALDLSRKLVRQFTYEVSPAFFDGQKKSVAAANCKKWQEAAEMIIRHQQPPAPKP